MHVPAVVVALVLRPRSLRKVAVPAPERPGFIKWCQEAFTKEGRVYDAMAMSERRAS